MSTRPNRGIANVSTAEPARPAHPRIADDVHLRVRQGGGVGRHSDRLPARAGSRERIEYVSPGVDWWGTLAEGPQPVPQPQWSWRPDCVAGTAQTEVWNTAVFGPAFLAYGPPQRVGDTLSATIALYGDGRPNRTGNAEYDTASTVLSRGARELFRGTSPGTFEAIPVRSLTVSASYDGGRTFGRTH